MPSNGFDTFIAPGKLWGFYTRYFRISSFFDLFYTVGRGIRQEMV